MSQALCHCVSQGRAAFARVIRTFKSLFDSKRPTNKCKNCWKKQKTNGRNKNITPFDNKFLDKVSLLIKTFFFPALHMHKPRVHDAVEPYFYSRSCAHEDVELGSCKIKLRCWFAEGVGKWWEREGGTTTARGRVRPRRCRTSRRLHMYLVLRELCAVDVGP